MRYRYFAVPLINEETLTHTGTRTIQDVLDEMTPEQKDLQALIVGAALDDTDISGNSKIIAQYNKLPEVQKLIIDFMVGNLLEEDSAFEHWEEAFYEGALAHFGVKGMRWGIRKSDDSPSLSRTSSAESRAAARAKVKSGSATLGEAHEAALKSTGHRAINAFTGDKTFWKRMAITAGVTGATAIATTFGPTMLPESTLTSVGSLITGTKGIAGFAASDGHIVKISEIGAVTMMLVGGYATAGAAAVATGAHVIGNTARAVGGNTRISRSHAALGKEAVARQTAGNKRVRKILNKSGSLSKSDLKHGSALEGFLERQGVTLKHAEARGPSEAPATRPGKKGGGKFDESKVKRDSNGKFSVKGATGKHIPKYKTDKEWKDNIGLEIWQAAEDSGILRRVAEQAAADLGIKLKDISWMKPKHVDAMIPYYVPAVDKLVSQPRFYNPDGTKRWTIYLDAKGNPQTKVISVRK